MSFRPAAHEVQGTASSLKPQNLSFSGWGARPLVTAMTSESKKELTQERGASVDSNQHNSGSPSSTSGSLSRRGFLGRVGTSTAVVAAGASMPSLLAREGNSAEEIEPINDQQRRNQAYQVRHQTAVAEKNIPLPPHPTNGDEDLYTNKIGNYSKALPHNSPGRGRYFSL